MKYKNVGVFPTVVSGLTVGVNATVHPAETDNPLVLPDGSTVVLNPGDVVDTELSLDHAGLELAKPNKGREAATPEA